MKLIIPKLTMVVGFGIFMLLVFFEQIGSVAVGTLASTVSDIAKEYVIKYYKADSNELLHKPALIHLDIQLFGNYIK